MTFAAWLARQTGRQDPVGDLACEVLADETAPGNGADLAAWRQYLAACHELPEVLEALEQGWGEYRGGRWARR